MIEDNLRRAFKYTLSMYEVSVIISHLRLIASSQLGFPKESMQQQK